MLFCGKVVVLQSFVIVAWLAESIMPSLLTRIIRMQNFYQLDVVVFHQLCCFKVLNLLSV